jgi:hypothetical protein
MSLSAYTLIEVDNTLQVVNKAVREAIEDTITVQSSITRADGASEDAVGVVLVVYMTKDLLGITITAKKEWTLQYGISLTDVYLEEICGDLRRQWLFNTGAHHDGAATYQVFNEYVRKQCTTESFMHVTNVCDVLADFFTHELGEIQGDAVIFPFAGWLHTNHPNFYEAINTPHINYGQLQAELYGEETGVPF